MNKINHIQNEFVFYSLIIVPILVFVSVTLLMYSLYTDLRVEGVLNNFLTVLKSFWFAGILFAFVNLWGLLRFGCPIKEEVYNKVNFTKWNKQKKLIVTYVSYGNNYKALRRAITKSQAVLERYGASYLIEVVTDIPVIQILSEKIIYTVVPSEYLTTNKTKYKARALHYMLEQREKYLTKKGNVWILHLDEESYLTESSVLGIHAFMNENELVIGQGEIQYNGHRYGRNKLITAVDAIRTGDDLGRFRLQLKQFNKPLFGVHGSYLLTPAEVEHAIGFDLGTSGSITEDAYFGLKAVDMGVKFDWVDGYIKEQSPFNVSDLLKQRRRWMNGLSLLVFDKTISFKTRWLLFMALFIWKISWVGLIATMLTLIIEGSYLPLPIALIGAVITGSFASLYSVGAYRNLQTSDMKWLRKVKIAFYTMLLLPISSLIESVSVVYAITRPITTFHTVAKN